MNPERLSALQEFLRHLMIAVSHAAMYSPRHEQTIRLIASAHKSLLDTLNGEDEISLMLIDDQIVAQEKRLPEGLYVNRFIQAFKSWGVEYLRILGGVDLQEVASLVTMLRTVTKQEKLLPLPHIRFGKVDLCYGSGGTPDWIMEDSSASETSVSVSDRELATLMEIYEAVKRQRRLRIVGIYDVVKGLVAAFRQEVGTLVALAPLRSMDSYTFAHSTNVCILNLAQAAALGIEGPLLHDIGVAAMLHDIGKLFVPEEILKKPGRLTDEEWDIIRQHPVKGARYLLDVPGVPRLAIVTAYEHHMRYNMSGYPKAPGNWRQNLCSQMTTISDYFDAMRTKRLYRGAMDWDAVISAMAGLSGTELHPVLLSNFLGQIDKLRQQPEGTPADLPTSNAALSATETFAGGQKG